MRNSTRRGLSAAGVRLTPENLLRAGKGVPAAAHSKSPFDGSKPILPCFPRRSVWIAALYDEGFVFNHPIGECLRHVCGFAWNSPFGGKAFRSRELHQQALVFRCYLTGAFFQERLLQVASRNPDFLTKLEHILLGELVTDVARPGLQLGGAMDDPLESLAVDAVVRRYEIFAHQ